MVLQFTEPLCILKVTSQASVGKVVVVLIELQTKQVFFHHGSQFPVSLVLGNAALNSLSLSLLPLQNSTTGTLGTTFISSLSGVNKKWSSYNVFLMLSKT